MKDRLQVLEAQLRTATTAHAAGSRVAPSRYSVLEKEGTTIVVPPGAVLMDLVVEPGHVETVFDTVPLHPETLSTADAAWTAWTYTSSVSNGTGWMDAVWEVRRESAQVTVNGLKRWLYSLNHQAVHKSTGVFQMHTARIRAVPKVSMDPLLDFEPAADTNHGNCSSATLGVGFKGINLSASATQCDKSDIRYWPKEPGKFENVWRGRAWRKERHVEYLLLASSPTKASGNSLWTVSNAFWAELKTGPIPS